MFYAQLADIKSTGNWAPRLLAVSGLQNCRNFAIAEMTSNCLVYTYILLFKKFWREPRFPLFSFLKLIAAPDSKIHRWMQRYR